MLLADEIALPLCELLSVLLGRGSSRIGKSWICYFRLTHVAGEVASMRSNEAKHGKVRHTA